MRSTNLLPWWMFCGIILGFEGEGDGGDGGAGDEGGIDEGDGAGGSEGDDAGDEGDDDLPDDKDIEGLKSALKKEREGNRAGSKQSRKLERELKVAQKKLQDIEDADKTEAEKAAKRAEAAETKSAKLALRLRTQAVDQLIEREARALGFKDVDDALSLIKRDGIEVDQDEDDPADIKVDAKSVKAAVKALADKKKHLIGDDEGQNNQEPSGSRFGGGPKDKAKANEASLKERYPSLR